MSNTLEKFMLKVLDIASGDERHNIEEAEVLYNALEPEPTMPPRDNCIVQPVVMSSKVITDYFNNKQRDNAIEAIKIMKDQLKNVQLTDDWIYTSYPITGPKQGTFISQWPLDCSSTISHALED